MSQLTELLTKHAPQLFRCRCGEKFKLRPLWDKGEWEEAWSQHLEEVWSQHLEAVLKEAGWVDAETYAISGRVSSMYQNRVKDLAKVLMDVKSLVDTLDPDLARQIGEVLTEAGFDE